MQKIFLLFLVIIGFSFPTIGLSSETIIGQSCYTYGDRESKQEARELTRTLAIRNAIESFSVYVESTGKVTNFTLTNDIIKTISSGYLKNITVLEHTEEGRTICDKISGTVEPKEIEKVIEKQISLQTKKNKISDEKDDNIEIPNEKINVISNKIPDSKIWEFYAKDIKGRRVRIMYYNKTNLIKLFDVIDVWTYHKQNFDHDHGVDLFEIDCKNRRIRLKEYICYDDKDNILLHQKLKEGGIEEKRITDAESFRSAIESIGTTSNLGNIIPGTLEDKLYQKVCVPQKKLK